MVAAAQGLGVDVLAFEGFQLLYLLLQLAAAAYLEVYEIVAEVGGGRGGVLGVQEAVGDCLQV